MPNASKSYFAFAPFNDWGVARKIHTLRDRITDKQALEYDESICNFLANRNQQGLPFPADFTSEPDQIIQIKRLHNDLYHAEELFRTLESQHTPYSTATKFLKFIDQAYETTHSLLTTCSQIEATFRPEITELLSYLSKAQGRLSNLSTAQDQPSAHSTLASKDSISLNTGLVVGRTINQMNPADTTGDANLFTYIGSVFPLFPTYIETARSQIEKLTAKNTEYVPSINQEKMEKLLEQGLKLSETIKNCNQNILLFSLNLLTFLKQITTLWSEISTEALNLSDTAQALAREIMARIKYDFLPNLFALVDKLEVQMMMKPGRLSKPLMEQAKQWYGSLIQYSKIIVKFDKKGEKLLKLEDSRFIELRIAPRRQEIETWTRTLHPINQALDTLNALKSLVDNLVDQRNPSAEEHEDYIRLRETLKKHVQHLEPHLKQACEKFKLMFEEQLAPTRGIIAYATDSWRGKRTYQPQPTMKAFMSHLNQLKTNHEFGIKRNESLIASVMEKAKIVLFPYNEQGNILDSQEEALPLNSSSPDAWSLYRKYENELTALTSAETNCAELMVKLEEHQERDGTIKFYHGYNPCLLKDNITPQPGEFHVQMKGGELNYAVLLQPIGDTEPVRLYIQSLEDAVTAEHKGYVWNKDLGQLSYIAPDGKIQSSVRLTDSVPLKLFVRLTNSKFVTVMKSKPDTGNGLVLTKDNITRLITDFGGHYPGSLRTGTIPCSEVGCTLTHVTSVDQLLPYLPRLFDEALERGHIQDEFREECIKSYSNIQPYLIGAFKHAKEKNIRAFDENVAELFSGHFYEETSRSSLSLTDFWLKLPGLKHILSEKKDVLAKKRDDSLAKLSNAPISVESARSAEIRHCEFSPDIAEFMYSMDPIKHQIHDSNKTLFKLELALQHLHLYHKATPNHEHQLRHPEENGQDDHFPWFQTWLYQLKKPIGPDIYKQLDAHLQQIAGYEKEQIKKNEWLIASVIEKNTRAKMPLPERIKPYDLSETSAFKTLYPINEASLMVAGQTPEANELLIKTEDGQLHYQYFRYGEIQIGKVTLTDPLADALEGLDENNVVSKDTLFEMLEHIYAVRKTQVEEKVAEYSPDEALDLYQWYRTKDTELDQAIKSFNGWNRDLQLSISATDPVEKLRLKSSAEQSFPLIQPYLIEAWKNDPAKRNFISTFDNACKYFAPNRWTSSKPIFAFFEAQKSGLKIKIRKYQEAAIEKPLFKIDDCTSNQADDAQKDDRQLHLIKHTKLSAQLGLVKAEMTTLYENLNAAFKANLVEASLGVPYPEIGDFSKSAPFVIAAAKPSNWSAISLAARQVVPLFHEWRSSPKSSAKKSNIPHQVLVYMRLKNAVYFIEQIMLQLEKINEHESKIPYVLHLVSAYQYLQDFSPMFEGLRDDPYLAATYSCMASKLKSMLNTLRDESQFYSGDEALKVNKHPSILRFMKVLKVFPEHISGLAPDFHKKYPGLEKSAETAAAKIETIINHVYNSHPYLRLFFDGRKVVALVRELHKDVSQLLNKTPEAVRQNLSAINTTIAKFVLDADLFEARQGLNPGTVSNTMKQIMEEFYKGLITPLVPLVDDRVRLLCNTDLIDQRIAAAESRERTAQAESDTHRDDIASMLLLLKVGCSESPKTGLNQLNDDYKASIPVLKKRLNGSDLHVMSFDAAKVAGHRDCFIWNAQQSQLFYIDADGMPNAQTGCSLALMSFPAGAKLPEVLEHKVTTPQPFGKQQPDYMIKVNVEKPTLIRQGDQYFIYIKPDGEGQKWTYVALDADIMSKIRLDFTKTKHLDIQEQYQAMYDEIASKANVTYPVHLKNTYRFIDFMKWNPVATPAPLYLSEREIQQLITSNSNFTLQRNGVSLFNERRSCLISMPSIPDPDNFDAPPDFDSCFVRVDGVQNALYLIDTKNKTMTEKRVLEGKESLFGRLMPTIHQNKLLIRDDFKKIESLTGHIEEPHVLSNVNTFVVTAENRQTLQALAERVEAHSNGLLATSDLNRRTASIQVSALEELKGKQNALDVENKTALYKKHFDIKVEEIWKKKVALHEYTLCSVKDKTKITTKIKANHVYVFIKGQKLHYKVIDANGMVQSDSFELREINHDPEKGRITANNLQPYLSDILKITANKGDGHTRNHSLATEYRKNLRATLEQNSALIISGALLPTASSIDDTLKDIKESFDKEHLRSYQQLGNIDKAVDDMRLYLNHATSLWSTKQSLFESKETIDLKKEILHNIAVLAADQDMPIKTRIGNIQSQLVDHVMLNKLLDYKQYDSICFAKLLQGVLRLFEAVGLYTPTVVQRADKLLRAIEGPTIQPQPFRFFAGSTRENVKLRIRALKAMDEVRPDVIPPIV